MKFFCQQSRCTREAEMSCICDPKVQVCSLHFVSVHQSLPGSHGHIMLSEKIQKFNLKVQEAYQKLKRAKEKVISKGDSMINIIGSVIKKNLSKIKGKEYEISKILSIKNDLQKSLELLEKFIIFGVQGDYLTTFEQDIEKKYLRFYSDIEIERGDRLKYCMICVNQHDINDIINLALCNHKICKRCFGYNVDYLESEGAIDNITRCPDPGCLVEIPPWQLEDIVSEALWDKISWAQIKKDKIVNCPRCKVQFIPGIRRRVMCPTTYCNFVFCKECQEKYHEVENCRDALIEERIKDLELLYNPNEVSQCPRCRVPYIRDLKCQSVKCLEITCRIQFCFYGACLTSPTIAHGNHYHRPECKFYHYNHGKDDKFLPNHCEMCKKLGELCKPPKSLKKKARVAPDEAVLLER